MRRSVSGVVERSKTKTGNVHFRTIRIRVSQCEAHCVVAHPEESRALKGGFYYVPVFII